MPHYVTLLLHITLTLHLHYIKLHIILTRIDGHDSLPNGIWDMAIGTEGDRRGDGGKTWALSSSIGRFMPGMWKSSGRQESSVVRLITGYAKKINKDEEQAFIFSVWRSAKGNYRGIFSLQSGSLVTELFGCIK